MSVIDGCSPETLRAYYRKWYRPDNQGIIIVAYESWPTVNADFAKDDEVQIVVMVNGKLRDKFMAAPNTDQEELKATAFTLEGVKKFTDGHEVVKTIVVPNKLVNIVVK